MHTELTEKKTLVYREKLAKSLQDLSSFQKLNKALFQKLFGKSLSIRKCQNAYFFENVFELFAAYLDNSVQAANKIKAQVLQLLHSVHDWSQFGSEFVFLNQSPELVAALFEDLENPIFTSLLMLLLCKCNDLGMKIYQLQEGSALVACEIGDQPKESQIRLAILVSPHGPRFALLEKNKGGHLSSTPNNIPKSLSDFSPAKNLSNDRGSFENYLESITNFEVVPAATSRTPKKELSQNELRMLKMIVDNLGICPQFFVDYSEYLRYKEFIQMAKKELGFLFHNVVKSVSQKSCQNIEFTTKESFFDSTVKRINQLPANITSFANFTNVMDSDPRSVLQLSQKPSNQANSKERPFEPPVVPSMANLAHFETPTENNTHLSFKRDRSFEPKSSFNNLNMIFKGEPNSKKEEIRKQLIYSNISIGGNDPSLFINRQSNQGMFQSVMSTTNLPKDIATPNSTGGTDTPITRKPVILEQNSGQRYSGTLKFYNEPKKFGFIVKDDDNSDIFFHLSDMELGGINEQMLLTRKDLKFSFVTMKYIGKKAESKKAVEVKLLY
jgi:cold shock CspA family protein